MRLVEFAIASDIQDFLVDTVYTLQFKNDSKEPVEALFTFPADDGVAVYYFAFELDGKKTIAQCREKEQVTRL